MRVGYILRIRDSIKVFASYDKEDDGSSYFWGSDNDSSPLGEEDVKDLDGFSSTTPSTTLCI